MHYLAIIWISGFSALAVYLLAWRVLRFQINRPMSGAVILSYLPTEYLARLSTRRAKITERAGRAWLERVFSYERVLLFKNISLIGAAAIIVLMIFVVPIDQVLFFGLLLFGFALYWPELYLARQAVFARRAAERQLPAVIDLLRLQIMSGKNLSAAIGSLAEHSPGIWSVEFGSMNRRLGYGLPFEEVLRESVARLQIVEFTHCVAAVKQAERLGISLSQTLGLQAALLRQKRKRVAETRARAAAVKIALPLALCIFPALLIVYLVPAILRVLITL